MNLAAWASVRNTSTRSRVSLHAGFVAHRTVAGHHFIEILRIHHGSERLGPLNETCAAAEAKLSPECTAAMRGEIDESIAFGVSPPRNIEVSSVNVTRAGT